MSFFISKEYIDFKTNNSCSKLTKYVKNKKGKLKSLFDININFYTLHLIEFNLVLFSILYKIEFLMFTYTLL